MSVKYAPEPVKLNIFQLTSCESGSQEQYETGNMQRITRKKLSYIRPFFDRSLRIPSPVLQYCTTQMAFIPRSVSETNLSPLSQYKRSPTFVAQSLNIIWLYYSISFNCYAMERKWNTAILVTVLQHL